MSTSQDNLNYTEDNSADPMMDEYRDLFFLEVNEHLQNLNDCLMAYEKDSGEISYLEEVFRSAHTLKGSSSMMGYEDISHLTHALEDAFDLLRKGAAMPEGLMDHFFSSLDLIENRIKNLEKNIDEKIDFQDIINLIHEAFDSNKVESQITISDDIHKEEQKSEERGQFKLQSIKSLRVQTSELDRLMNLIGELVISKGQLTERVSRLKIPELTHNVENIDRLSTELQEIVTHIRLVPVEHIFNRFPRLVRDLSNQKNKQISLVIEGKDIELDRKVLEELGDPLVHLLRNSVDHGIELPDDREAAGKTREGTITLSAIRKPDHIMIIVKDDGAGIDPEKLKDKAIKENILSKTEADNMTEGQLLNLILLNGFTTASNVTEVSGRGVGMNVVKTKIEALGGNIFIESSKGEGTTMSLKLPLTLSILKVMIVESGETSYAIPLKYVKENVSIRKGLTHSLGKDTAIKLRDRVIKIIPLGALLNTSFSDNENKKILVVQDGTSLFGLEVDKIVEMREIMIKEVNSTFQNTKGISGVTILGDGRIIFVIDPILLISQQKLVR